MLLVASEERRLLHIGGRTVLVGLEAASSVSALQGAAAAGLELHLLLLLGDACLVTRSPFSESGCGFAAVEQLLMMAEKIQIIRLLLLLVLLDVAIIHH